MAKMTDNAAAVLEALRKGEAAPSVLAERTGLSVRTVRRYTAQAVENGWATAVKGKAGDVYRLRKAGDRAVTQHRNKAKGKVDVCDVCARRLPPRKGTKGRQRLRHRECSAVMARIKQLRNLGYKIRFAPGEEGEARRASLKSQIFGLSSDYQQGAVKIADTDRDYL